MRLLQWIAVLVLFPTLASAASLSLSQITSTDYEKLVKEFSGNFAYSTLTPASSLGGFGGFEFGVVAGQTRAKELHSLVKRNDPNTTFKDKLYHGGALLRVGAPYGLTGELLIFPKITVSNLDAKQYGGAAMWTITDVYFTDLPVTLATKLFYTSAEIGYSQTINNASTGNTSVNARVEFENTLWGAQALVSRKFSIVEPYLGFGYLRAKGKLTIAATVPGVLASFFTDNSLSQEAKPNTFQFLAGLDARLAFFSLGAEYQRAFGTTSLSGRISFRF